MKKALIPSLLLVFAASGCFFSGENLSQFDPLMFAGCVLLVLALAWLMAGVILLASVLAFFITHFIRRKP